jgi:hypothetical protein
MLQARFREPGRNIALVPRGTRRVAESFNKRTG